MSEDRGVQGFKKSEFATDKPDEVFETSDIRVEDLPEGVRLYLRGKAVDLNTKKLTVRIYRLKDEGGQKDVRESVGILINRFPEEEDVGEMYGPGRYIAIGKWKSTTGTERGIITEPMLIGEDWRAAHEAWKRKQAPREATAPAVATAPAASPLGSVEGILAIMAAAEEKSLATFERIAAIMGGQRQESPVEVLKTAYQGANQMIMDSVKQVQDMAKSVKDKAKAELHDDDRDDDDDDGQGDDGEGARGNPMPEWIEAFMPQVKQWLGTLIGGGPVGNAVKTLVLNSEDFQAIFRDKDKWATAVAAMETEFGTEQTQKALKVLLNKREAKPAAPPPVAKSKGKGKR